MLLLFDWVIPQLQALIISDTSQVIKPHNSTCYYPQVILNNKYLSECQELSYEASKLVNEVPTL